MLDILNITTDSLQILKPLLGLGLIGYSTYGLINKSNNENKICNYKELNSLVGDGVLLSKHVRLSVKQSNEHVLMIAPSGCGKSRRFVAHNINRLRNCSIITNDPSCELEKMCFNTKRKYILNPFSDKTIGYDPLLNCRNEFEIRKMAGVILTNGMKAYAGDNSNQQDWVGMATPLLTSYMLMNYHTHKYTFDEMIKNICTMPILANIEIDKQGNIIGATKSIELDILLSEVESAKTEFDSFIQVKGANQTLSSIRTVLNSCLQVFLDNNVKKIFRKKNINFADIRKEESIIYIQIPEHHADYFSPLVATFLTQMFDYLLENDGLQTYFLFDEFTNCGLIPSVSKLLSTARKHNISIIAAIQSLVQLYSLYGELQGKELIDLFKSLIVCGGLKESGEYISNILGNKIFYKNGNKHEEALMTSDKIRMMNEDDMLIICKNKRPVLDKMMEIVA